MQCLRHASSDDRGTGVGVDAVGLVDVDVDKPRSSEGLKELGAGEGAGDTTGPLLHVGSGFVVHVWVGDDVGDGESAPRPEYPGRLPEDRTLVSGQVDDAIGDHHIDGGVG